MARSTEKRTSSMLIKSFSLCQCQKRSGSSTNTTKEAKLNFWKQEIWKKRKTNGGFLPKFVKKETAQISCKIHIIRGNLSTRKQLSVHAKTSLSRLKRMKTVLLITPWQHWAKLLKKMEVQAQRRSETTMRSSLTAKPKVMGARKTRPS